MTADAILMEIIGMLADIVGDDLLLLGEITPATSLNDDLSLESIEFVALAEKLRERYGPRADLTGLLAGMDIDDIMAMTVGTLVGYVGESLRQQPASSGTAG